MHALRFKSIIGICLLLITCTTHAQQTSPGQIHFLGLDSSGLMIAIRSSENGQVMADPESCGSNNKFYLSKAHINYDALSGVLLTYYFSGRTDVSLNLSGCTNDKPTITIVKTND